MPASTVHVPGYCRHAARDLAYVRLGGKVTYLGRYGTPESKAEYRRLLGQWMGTPRQVAAETLSVPAIIATPILAPQPSDEGMTVREFSLAYLKVAQVRYTKNRHFGAIRTAFLELDKLFGKTPITDLGPKRLKEVRTVFIKKGLKRREINRRTKWIVNGVKRAVGEELVPGEVLYRLSALEVLRYGEAPVPESPETQPVEESLVIKTIEQVSLEVAAMARIQLLAGPRPGEVCIMRPCDIKMDGDVWEYRPATHKTQWRGQPRMILLGKRAQEILAPFLPDNPEDFVFSPARAETRRRQARHEARITPDSCGNNVGTNCVWKTKREPGDHYTPTAYARAITRGIEKAFPLPGHLARKIIVPSGRKKTCRLETEREWRTRLTPQQRAEVKVWCQKNHWHPHQLRHTHGQHVRDEFTPEHVQAVLGHAHLKTSEIYGKVSAKKAAEVARRIG